VACPHVAGGETVAGMEGDFRYTKSLVAYSLRGVHIHFLFYGWPATTGRNDSILLNVTNAARHDVITASCGQPAEVVMRTKLLAALGKAKPNIQNVKA